MDDTVATINALHAKLADGQQKFVYLLISFSVGAIGFSVLQTAKASLSLSQIPLLLAVGAWGMSIRYGLRNLIEAMALFRANIAMLYLKIGTNPATGEPAPKDTTTAMETLAIAATKASDNTGKFFNLEQNFFYAGVVLFLAWHILEMYLRDC